MDANAAAARYRAACAARETTPLARLCEALEAAEVSWRLGPTLEGLWQTQHLAALRDVMPELDFLERLIVEDAPAAALSAVLRSLPGSVSQLEVLGARGVEEAAARADLGRALGDAVCTRGSELRGVLWRGAALRDEGAAALGEVLLRATEATAATNGAEQDLSPLVFLETFELRNCGMGTAGVRALCAAFRAACGLHAEASEATVIMLKTLDLSGNPISPAGLVSIMEFIGAGAEALLCLQRLVLEDLPQALCGDVGEPQNRLLATVLRQNRTIREVCLDGHGLGPETLAGVLCPIIKENKTLTTLHAAAAEGLAPADRRVVEDAATEIAMALIGTRNRQLARRERVRVGVLQADVDTVRDRILQDGGAGSETSFDAASFRADVTASLERAVPDADAAAISVQATVASETDDRQSIASSSLPPMQGGDAVVVPLSEVSGALTGSPGGSLSIQGAKAFRSLEDAPNSDVSSAIAELANEVRSLLPIVAPAAFGDDARPGPSPPFKRVSAIVPAAEPVNPPPPSKEPSVASFASLDKPDKLSTSLSAFAPRGGRRLPTEDPGIGDSETYYASVQERLRSLNLRVADAAGPTVAEPQGAAMDLLADSLRLELRRDMREQMRAVEARMERQLAHVDEQGLRDRVAEEARFVNRIDTMERRQESLSSRLNRMEEAVAEIQRQMTQIQGAVSGLEGREEDRGTGEARVQADLGQRMDALEARVEPEGLAAAQAQELVGVQSMLRREILEDVERLTSAIQVDRHISAKKLGDGLHTQSARLDDLTAKLAASEEVTTAGMSMIMEVLQGLEGRLEEVGIRIRADDQDPGAEVGGQHGAEPYDAHRSYVQTS